MPVLSVEEMTGMTATELERAFELVRNPEDWRGRIDAVVENADVPAVCMAIRFYTATEPSVMPLGGGRSRVLALGYRRGPAGDH